MSYVFYNRHLIHRKATHNAFASAHCCFHSRKHHARKNAPQSLQRGIESAKNGVIASYLACFVEARRECTSVVIDFCRWLAHFLVEDITNYANPHRNTSTSKDLTSPPIKRVLLDPSDGSRKAGSECRATKMSYVPEFPQTAGRAALSRGPRNTPPDYRTSHR